MATVRTCLAALAAIALALYGAAATALAHAHDSAGYHSAHIVTDHHHDGDDHDAPHGVPAPAGDDGPASPASDHHETGFHSHGVPQFSPVTAASVLFLPLTIGWIDYFDLDDLGARAPDESPFKPPRARL